MPLSGTLYIPAERRVSKTILCDSFETYSLLAYVSIMLH